MDYVFVLEDDPVYRRQIEDSIKTIPGQFQVKIYESLAAFADQIKALMVGGAKGLSQDGDEPVKIRLVICKMEFIGPNRLSLLSKTRDFLIRRGLCPADEPTQFVLTAFDEPHFQIDQYKKAILANLIFKPFDRLMLEQHLQMAIEGKNNKGAGRLAAQKTSALVEMLKSVDVQGMSEIGFRSSSNRAFEVGSVNKYYGKEFESDRHRSVMARLVACTPMPDQSFQLDFHFFALDGTQISNMRKKMKVKDGKSTSKVAVPAGNPNPNPLFVILDPDDEQAKSLGGSLSRKVAGAEVIHFRSKMEWDQDSQLSRPAKNPAASAATLQIECGKDLIVTKCTPDGATLFGDPLASLHLGKFMAKEDSQNLAMWFMSPKTEATFKMSHNGEVGVFKIIRETQGFKLVEQQGKERSDFLQAFRKVKRHISALYVSHKEIDFQAYESWKSYLEIQKAELVPGAPVFMLASREFTDDEERMIGIDFSDIFFLPLDRIYLLQKLIFSVPGLKIQEEPIEVIYKVHPQVVRAANPVTMEEVSEATMVINYYRPLELDEFRDFILWQPYELTAPELSARVFKTEAPADAKNPAKIRFVFFGVKDHQAKGVRLWTLNNYIAAKDKDK